MKKYLLLLLLALPACEYLTAYGDLESDPRYVQLQDDISERALKIEGLIGEIDSLKDKLSQEGLTADFAAQAGMRLAEAVEEVGLIANLQERAKVDIEAIAKEHAVPEWQLWAGTAVSAIVGMGIPTSGPLAGLLGGLGPLLEFAGVRNRRKRKQYHLERDQEKPV